MLVVFVAETASAEDFFDGAQMLTADYGDEQDDLWPSASIHFATHQDVSNLSPADFSSMESVEDEEEPQIHRKKRQINMMRPGYRGNFNRGFNQRGGYRNR